MCKIDTFQALECLDSNTTHCTFNSVGIQKDVFKYFPYTFLLKTFGAMKLIKKLQIVQFTIYMYTIKWCLHHNHASFNIVI